MYLPKSLHIVSPYVTRWYGKSGRQYEFGVVRSTSFWFEEPAVYVLARHEGDRIVPLSIGQMEGGRTGPNGGMPREWVQALAEGMTHAHLRFEARSNASRQAEVEDLMLALRPRCSVCTQAGFQWDQSCPKCYAAHADRRQDIDPEVFPHRACRCDSA
jgi:hypothetical protein